MKVKWVYYAYRKRIFVLWITLRRDQNHLRCAYCDCAYTRTGRRQRSIDHVIPLSKGGKNWPSNMLFSCVSCNQHKGSLTLEDFIGSNWLSRRRESVLRIGTVKGIS